jgi:hypothetical protein
METNETQSTPTAITKSTDPLFRAEQSLTTFDQAKLLDHFKVSDNLRDVFLKVGEHLSPERPLNRFRNKTFLNVWFKNVTVENVAFHDCIFEDCRFIGTEFRSCEFHDCEFRRCNTHKIQFDRTYIDPLSFIKMPDKNKYWNIGVYLFQQLLRNSSEMHQAEFADAAEYEFKRWKRYEFAYKWRNRDGRRWRNAKRWLVNMFWFVVSGYGLKPLRVVCWLTILLLGVVTVNYNFWTWFDFNSSSGLSVSQPTVALAIYYSVVTLTTLGYGDVTPRSSFGLITTSVEVVFGLIALGILASALVKKVLR